MLLNQNNNVIALPYRSWADEYRHRIKYIEKWVRSLTEEEKCYLGKIFNYLEARYERSPDYHKEIFCANYPDFSIEKMEYYMRTSLSGALWIHATMLFEDESFYIKDDDVQPQ